MSADETQPSTTQEPIEPETPAVVPPAPVVPAPVDDPGFESDPNYSTRNSPTNPDILVREQRDNR